MRSIARVMVGVDRSGGELVNLIFCETGEDLRRADAFLNSLSPEPGGGHRAGIGMYEIAIRPVVRLGTRRRTAWAP